MKAWPVALGLAAVAAVVAVGVSRKASASTSPVPRPASPQCDKGSFAGLRAVEVLTGGAAASDDVPVHVFLHGRGVSPEALVPYVRKIDARARHLLLEGPTKVGSGRAWTVARCADQDQGKLAAQATWTADLLERAIEEIVECYGRRVVVSGLSNGGMMAYAIAARALPTVEGVVAQAGCLPESMRSPMRNTVGIHGTNDQAVPFARTAEFAEGLGVTWRPIAGGGHDSADVIAAWREHTGSMLA